MDYIFNNILLVVYIRHENKTYKKEGNYISVQGLISYLGHCIEN